MPLGKTSVVKAVTAAALIFGVVPSASKTVASRAVMSLAAVFDAVSD